MKNIVNDLLDNVISDSVLLKKHLPIKEDIDEPTSPVQKYRKASTTSPGKNDKIPIPNFLLKLYFGKLKPLIKLKQATNLESLINAEKMILAKNKKER